MGPGSRLLRNGAMEHWGASRSELLGVAVIFALALALRMFPFLGTGSVAGGCTPQFLQQIAPILRSGNPLHFEVFFYPPVPAITVAGLAGVWRTLGGGGDLSTQCGAIALMFSLATVLVVYMIGRFWGRPHALIAMALYAVTMIAVVTQGNVQVYSTFFLSLAIYAILRAHFNASVHTCALAGICLGLGVGSKYSPIFFAGILFMPYLLFRWKSGRAAGEAGFTGVGSGNGTLLARVWTFSAWVLVGLALGILWVGVMEREFVYGLLRGVYDRHSHENPFEFHLPWIDRLYGAGLAGVALAGLAGGLALFISWMRNMSPWDWARSFLARNRWWAVPCIALGVTMVVFMGLPAVVNLNDFTRHLVFMMKSTATGDNGFFPGHNPAPSKIGAYIPESMGLFLFAAGLAGIPYVFARRDNLAALLIASAIPPYVILELSRLKVNRYAMELFPLWCLLAAIWLGDLYRQRRAVLRFAGLTIIVATVTYSALYSLAWGEFFSLRGHVQVKAGKWLNANVPPGTSVGVRSALLVTGSPALVPGSDFLAPYVQADYTEEPEYVLLPNAVYEIVLLYLEGREKGYVYNEGDWFPSRPTSADLDALSRIVREEGYILVEEFRKRPVVFAMELGSDSLTGRTWLAEHSHNIGVRIYRRIESDG